MFRIPKMNSSVTYHVHNYRCACARMLCSVSLLTTVAISVDRLLALLLGLRYRHVVTSRRIRAICFWIMGASNGLIQLWIRRQSALMEVTVFITLCLATSIFCYTWIHLKLRQNQAKIQNVSQVQVSGRGIPLNILRYRKTVSNMLWVQLTLVACYVPFGIVAVLAVNGIENSVAWLATENLAYINSSLNPILYCWKIKAVRQAVKNTVKQLSCS